jgi:hypothetical protein
MSLFSIPATSASVTYLKKPLIPPGTLLPDWVIENIVASEQKESWKQTTYGNIFPDPVEEETGQLGAVGYWVEDQLANLGLPVNKNNGIDLPPWNVEIKTRKLQAVSPHTFGQLSLKQILATPWKDSPLMPKCQLNYQVIWDRDHMRTCVDRIVDLRQTWRQKLFEQAYNQARDQLIAYYCQPRVTKVLRRTAPIGGLYLETAEKELGDENKLEGIVYKFRVRFGLMKEWEIAGRKNTYDSLFLQ